MFSLFAKKEKPPRFSAIVVAAGSASRMQGIDKQQVCIDEIPVVVRSVQQLSFCPAITEVVLVCREEMIPDYYALAQDFGLDKVSSVVAGGATRQDSVFRGVSACSGEADYFVIHDGARPLVTPEVIDSCLQAAVRHGAAAAGVPVKDTIKVASANGFIATTPNRDSLFAIQTPQVFEAGLYHKAMAAAKAQNRQYTDDCQLVEQWGRPVFIARGSYENMKITTPEDIAVAQAIINYREYGLEEQI